MDASEERLVDAAGLDRLVEETARGIADGGRRPGPLLLGGIRSRGYPIALRVVRALGPLVGTEVSVGAVDITLYRDDLDHGRRWPVLHGTEIPFDMDGADVVLIDDVMYTGRTARALNAVCDLGRPSRVRLAVLVDRGHRELPIQPDVVGMVMPTGPDERVQVRIRPTDPFDEVIRSRNPGA
ncbi:MAG: bifunctional pyr operon transcriptional regulator/uracil phosphoribosyltransferase PyrR [Isosphaeraceae bacterium]